jgi:hypothetical protein
MDLSTYASRMEQKLIDEFKQKFYEKLGYYPMVVTKVGSGEDLLPIMALHELEEIFEPYLPTISGKRLSLRDKARNREIVELRQIFCSIARQMKYSLKSIGSHVGGRDHTTVIHNTTTCNHLVETDEQFKIKYLTIIKRIKEKYEPAPMDVMHQEQYQPKSDILSEFVPEKYKAF